MTKNQQPFSTLRSVSLLLLVAGSIAYAVNAVRPTTGSWFNPPAATPAPAAENSVPGLEELRTATPETLLLVDARGPLFFKWSHIPGSISIPKKYLARDLPAAAPILRQSANKRVVVYCAAEDCDDSLVVARELIQFGIKKVYIFKGGWQAWRAATLPEEKS